MTAVVKQIKANLTTKKRYHYKSRKQLCIQNEAKQMFDNLRRTRKEERNSYIHRQHSRQMNKKGWKTEISKAITDSTHAKRREGWKRERNRAIDTDSTHTKRRR